MIFNDFYPHKMRIKIKDNPEYENILNNTLKIIDSIDQSMYEPIQKTYSYL